MISINEFPKPFDFDRLSEYLDFLKDCKNSIIHEEDSRNIHTHHIVPRIIGGTDDSNNLITLRYQDHAKAHALLSKAYRDNLSLSYAAYVMNAESLDEELRSQHLENLRKSTVKRNQEYFFMNRGNEEVCVKRVDREYYEELGYVEGMSRVHREKLGESHKGLHHTEETKLKQSIANATTHVGDIWINNSVEEKTIPESEFLQYESLGYIKGRLPFSESHRKNLSREFSDNHRKNLSISAKNREYDCKCNSCSQLFKGKAWNTKYCNECKEKGVK